MDAALAAFELPEELLKQAQYHVGEDPDQPGLYQWTRTEGGVTVGGCDASFSTAEEAWEEVRETVALVLQDEAGFSADEWNALTGEERRLVIHREFGDF